MSVVSMTVQNNQDSWWMTEVSSYSKNLRVVALVLRYVNKLRKKSTECGLKPTQAEVEEAELRIFGFIQNQVFPDDKNFISGLKVVRVDGLIRVVTKLVHRQDSEGFKYPVLLPSSHPLVDRLIREEHIFNCHAGTQFLMSKLRERCWIVQGRRAIKKIVKSCVICRRFSTKCPTVPPAPLPENRVKNATAFEVTGIDLAGPLVLKNKSKCWIVLFTCAVYRCVHMELVQTLSSEDFIMAFVRFCNRKRRPKIVYTDNGTNFVGSVNLFKTIDWKEVERRTQQERIHWQFNPPSAPWWGGWWERLIRSVKDLLKRMLGFGKLTYCQLETCVCEVEAVMNNRPLTYVTEDQDDLIPLTPAMFMYDMPYSNVPESQVITVSGLHSKFKNMQQLSSELKSRFREEYLSQLVQRGKDRKHEDFKVGDVVLVGVDNKKRIEWPMARVLELIPGKDGKCRVAKVKTTTGELIRPLQRLYPLEISCQEDSPHVPLEVNQLGVRKNNNKVTFCVPEVYHTRSGREVKVPIKYQ